MARQLALEHGLCVRLFIDQPQILDVMAPVSERPANLVVLDWAVSETAQPAALVLATFCCRLPAAYLQNMARRNPPPVWINVEYLSAESWVETHHKLPSRQPKGALTEYFFYPGFTERTGGLLRERDALSNMAQARAAHVSDGRFRISLFCYPTPAIDGLIAALAQGAREVELLVPHGKATTFLKLDAPRQLGRVTLVPIAMQSQRGYDQMLATCDFNIVRGEDSFVRAHWAGVPFLWHIYGQAENAHLTKLAAWLDRFAPFVPTAQLAHVIATFHYAWNTDDAPCVASLWPALAEALGPWQQGVQAYQRSLASQPDCATQLVDFAKNLGVPLK